MNCVIYKGSRKADTYLFVEQKDCFERLPKALLEMLGSLELVMELELSEERKLAQANPAEVIKHLAEQGFYVQMPPSHGHPLDQQKLPC